MVALKKVTIFLRESMKKLHIFSVFVFSCFMLLVTPQLSYAMDIGEGLSREAEEGLDTFENGEASAFKQSVQDASDVQNMVGKNSDEARRLGRKFEKLNRALEKAGTEQGEDAVAAQDAVRKAQQDLDSESLLTKANDTLGEDKIVGGISQEDRAFTRIKNAKERFEKAIEKGSSEEIENARQDLEKALDESTSAQGKALRAGRKLGRGLLGGARFLAEQLPMVAIFTVPSWLQAGMQAGKQKEAALKSVAQAIDFGNWKLQLASPCIDYGNPMQSIPLYFAIPADQEGDVSDEAVKAFGDSIKAGGAAEIDIGSRWKSIYTLGGDQKFTLTRYDVTNPVEFAKHTKFVMSYPAQSYNNIGASLVTGPEFSGLMIDINDGVAVDATGEHYNAVFPVPLIPMKAHAPTVEQMPVKSVAEQLPGILSKFKESGMMTTETTGVFAGTTTGPSISDYLQAYFNCSDKTGRSFLEKGTCVIQKSLGKYSAGGVSFGVFGAMTPLWGWNKTGYEKVINPASFPHNVPLSFNQSGAVVTDLGKAFVGGEKITSASTVKEAQKVYAPVANYAAQGCWVYLCTSSPFLQKITEGKKHLSPHGPYVDYVIFFDDEMNQVPLQVPVDAVIPGVDDDVKWPRIMLNPNAKYMASLISTGLADFQVEYQGEMVPAMYDQNGEKASMADLSSLVGQAISRLQQSFPLLYSQFKAHRNALVSRYHFGPFEYGSTDLIESKYKIIVTQGQEEIDLKFYQGSYCLGTQVEDLLLPMTEAGGTAVLPNSTVKYFVSLVTDIEYEIQADKSLKPSSYAHAPGSWDGKGFTPDERSNDTFYWFSKIATNPGANPSQVAEVQKYLTMQRDQWIEMYDGSDLSQGFSTGKLHFTLADGLSTVEASKNSCFIYNVAPNPSAELTQKDFYIVTDVATPSLEGLKIVNVAATPDEAQSLVSLITGNVYDMNGMLRTSKGRPVVIQTTGGLKKETTSQYLYDYLTTLFPVGKGLSSTFKQMYKNIVDRYAKEMNQPLMVGEFAGVPLGIYAGDLHAKNYVYFNTSGLNASKNFEPTDLLVTVSVKGGATIFGDELTPRTQYMVSLISGQIYARSGPDGQMNRDTVWNFANRQGFYWRATLKGIFDRLKVKYVSKKSVEEKQFQAFKDQQKEGPVQGISLTEEDVRGIISRLSGFLPAPYAQLQQDPQTGIFVYVVSSAVSGQQVTSYTIFDVPNTFTDDTGAPMSLGVIYGQDGNQVQVLTGSALESMKLQLGLYGAANKLAVPVQEPGMLMRPNDYNLKPGSNGETMVVSTSPDFPGQQVKMPTGYHLYYSLLMDTYYVLNSSTNEWITLFGGHVYNRQGQPVPARYSGLKGESSKELEKLVMLPVGKNFELLRRIPDKKVESASLLMQDGHLNGCLFAGRMYDVTRTATANVYSLKAVQDPSVELVMQMLVDNHTRAPYVKITVGTGPKAVSYVYAYKIKQLDPAEQDELTQKVVKGAITVCPVQMPVGPMLQKDVTVDGKELQVKHPRARTHVLFSSDIVDADLMAPVNPNSVGATPKKGSKEYDAFAQMLFRVYKSADGRYLGRLYKKDDRSFHEPFIGYFNQDGFVNLQTGALFDQSGKAVGKSLMLEDWLMVLEKLQVTVVKNKSGKYELRYKRPLKAASASVQSAVNVADTRTSLVAAN